MNSIFKYLLLFLCLFLSSVYFSQTLNNTTSNQLYFKLNSLENISKFSWKQIEDIPLDIPLDLFPFKDFLDSIGAINISQPFGKKKEFTNLYLTFLVQLRGDYPDLNKIFKDTRYRPKKDLQEGIKELTGILSKTSRTLGDGIKKFSKQEKQISKKFRYWN